MSWDALVPGDDGLFNVLGLETRPVLLPEGGSSDVEKAVVLC